MKEVALRRDAFGCAGSPSLEALCTEGQWVSDPYNLAP